MTTVRKLITGANRLINNIGSSEELSAEDMDISLQALNSIIDNWSNNKLNVFKYRHQLFDVIPNKSSYSLGPGGDWEVERPLRVEKMNLVLDEAEDALYLAISPLTYAQFGDITLRGTQSTIPKYFYDNGAYPLREISIWPVPLAPRQVEIWMWEPIINYISIDDEVDLPDGYERALRFALAVEIAPEFMKVVDGSVANTAATSLMEIQRLNQEHPIRQMNGPRGTNAKGFNFLTGLVGTPATWWNN